MTRPSDIQERPESARAQPGEPRRVPTAVRRASARVPQEVPPLLALLVARTFLVGLGAA